MGWFEVLSVGLDVAQAAQLSEARESIGKLEQRTLVEAVHKEIIENLRNLVFASKKAAESLESQVKAMPISSYVGACILDMRLQNFGVVPDLFPDFADKEYVHKTQKAISQLKMDAASKLSSSQLKRGNETVDAIVEIPRLHDIKQANAATIEFKRLQAFRTAAILGGILSLFACANANSNALVLIVPVAAVVLWSMGSPKRYAELKKQIPTPEKWQKIKSKFGELTDLHVDSMISERNKLVAEVMGESESVEDYDRLL